MTPSPEAKKAAKELNDRLIRNREQIVGGYDAENPEDIILAVLSAERAKAEAEFQARLGEWRGVVEEIFDRYEKIMLVLPTEGDIGMLQRLNALLSSPDALTAQAREAEIPESGRCEKEFYCKEREISSRCGRDFGHSGNHSWYTDCWSCGGMAGEHFHEKCAAYPAKTADKPKEDAH